MITFFRLFSGKMNTLQSDKCLSNTFNSELDFFKKNLLRADVVIKRRQLGNFFREKALQKDLC